MAEDYIKREDAIDAIATRAALEESADRSLDLTKDFFLDYAEDVLKDCESIDAVPHWIPCEEMLPELDEICLVTEKDGSIRHCYFDSADPVLFATVEEGMYVRNVVAWMPLPEPYGGEREDDE